MGRSRLASFIIFLTLSFFLLPLAAQPAAGANPLLWSFSPKSSATVTTQTIEDLSGDDHQDIFIATSALTRYSNYGIEELPAEFLILDGKSGRLDRSRNLGMTSVGGAFFVEGRVVSSRGKALEIYDSGLNELYNKTFSESPRLVGSMNGSRIVFALSDRVTLFDVETYENIWTWTAPAQITSVLIMGNAVIVAYPEYLVMLMYNGVPMTRRYVPRQELSSATLYTESLHKLDGTRFLYLEDAWVIFGQSPRPSLSMWEINGVIFDMKWKIDVGGGAANKPHVISDIDSDGVNDLICRRNEDYRIAVFSGKTGEQVYSTDISGYYVYASTSISDIDQDGIAEAAVNPYSENEWHGLRLMSFKGNYSVSYEIRAFNLYSHLVAIQDIDGDDYLDIVGATLGGKIEAYRGFDSRLIPDTTPPSISIVSPENKTYATKDIPLTFSLNEPAVRISYNLDNQANTTIDDGTTLKDLTDGAHSLIIYAEDSAGNVGKSAEVYFTVDTTLPKIRILSPENKTYATTSVLLDFSVNEQVSWISYRIDGGVSVTITHAVTLSELAEGAHRLVVYASDVAGNIAETEDIYFSVDSIPPIVNIKFPQNRTYKTTTVPLNLNVNEETSWMGYSIDGQANTTLHGNATMSELAQGSHILIVYAKDVVGNVAQTKTIYFSVDSILPTIEIKSPQNTTYTTSSVYLDFTINEPTAWVRYSLDGQANVTINGNNVLSALSDGPHTIVMYAEDTAGNRNVSSAVYFNINKGQAEEDPKSLSWIIYVALAIIGTTAAFVVILRKRKH